MVQYLDVNADDKKRIRARYQAEENRICAESGLSAMELKLDSKRLELSRARQTKESSLVNGLTQLASTASHFENSGKLQQKEQLQSQLLGYESQRSLNSYEEQQLEQLLSQIETLKTTSCSYSESTSVQNKIDALEKQANRLRFGKDMTFRELESQKQKMQQKIASIKPQSVLSTALHATNATYNAVVFFNQGQKIKNLEEEVSSLSSKLDEIRAQITPRIKQLNREREKALDEQEVSIRKLLEARLEKLEASN
jgi:regulator of replication initiation timing